MIDLTERSNVKELLDRDDIPFADIRRNMIELNAVNKYLGGHSISISGLKTLLINKKGPVTICEIGSGGGDNLNALDSWCTKHNMEADFIGIDIKQECSDFAATQYPSLKSKWITADYSTVTFNRLKPSVVFSSLFCHHFSDTELVQMIRWMKSNATQGFFINDLHRNILAFYLIKFITRIFSKSYLVKNDAPLSVARGFRKREWRRIFAQAGINSYEIRWRWAFRYLIVCRNEQ